MQRFIVILVALVMFVLGRVGVQVVKQSTWTFDQWIMFGSFVVAGLAGLCLVALWVTARHEVQRASTAVRRALVHDCNEHEPYAHSRAWAIGAGRTDVTPLYGTPAALITAVDPTGELLAHIAPGPGSLTTLREQEERDTLIHITHDDLVDPGVRHDVATALDEALRDFATAVEPAMRKARLWLLQGHADHASGGAPSAWAALQQWRIDTPTGEMPIYQRPDAARVAEAMLVAT